MKRVRLTSIEGVTRNERRDYRDDGATFKAYLYKNTVPFTYTTWENEIFLSIRLDMAGMDWDEYKNIKERDEFNGVSRESWDPVEFKKCLDVCYNAVEKKNA